SSRVEKAVSGLDGVAECSVNLLTGDMTVEGTVSEEAVVSAVTKAGYGAYPADTKFKST
ncbi:MAG: cation transporter, partial [Clostridia bacterium]|nr:cation transporter [Clostridia bacterium]